MYHALCLVLSDGDRLAVAHFSILQALEILIFSIRFLCFNTNSTVGFIVLSSTSTRS